MPLQSTLLILSLAAGAPAAAGDELDDLFERARLMPVKQPAGKPAEDPLDACLRQLDAQPPVPPEPQPPPPQPRWQAAPMPAFDDDVSRASLIEAARRTAAFWSTKAGRSVSVNGRDYTAESLAKALTDLAQLAQAAPDSATLRTRLTARFDALESLTQDGSLGKVTGYLTPTIPLAAQPGPDAVPLYGSPQPEIPKAHPDFTARKISEGSLQGRAPALYGALPGDLMTLQIQGSGWGTLPDGSKVFLSWDGGNGHMFRSVSRSLHQCGITPRVLGQPELDAFLKSLPISRQQKAVTLNPSFVFFSAAPTGAATGSTGIQLTPHRSVAVDKALVPLGLPGILISRKTVADGGGRVTGQRDFARLIFTHDIGGAIKGGTRVDLFFGGGVQEEAEANHQNFPGRLFVLLPR